MSELNLIKPTRVQNIINKFCYTIGMIPTSYKVALTYEEQIMAIGHYIEDTLTPALNNNAEAVAEIQDLFIELKDFVENYFDKLDLQLQINKKIDNLVSNGTLQNLINNRFNVLENKINSVSSGSPAGIFETLNLLKNDLKTDKNKIYLVKEDGKWYYFNLNANDWQAGGIYQSSIISNNEISSDNIKQNSIKTYHTNFIKTVSKNLFNKDNISQPGEWCNYTNGKIESNNYTTTFSHSDFIPVTPNTTWARTYGSGSPGICYFDINKNFISGEKDNVNGSTPENCYFVILNFTTTHAKNLMFFLNYTDIINSSHTITPYVPFEQELLNSNYLKDNFVKIGKGGYIENLNVGFKFARANKLNVIIMPGTYDLLEEGISLTEGNENGNGIILPHIVKGYGAKLIANLNNEDWSFSPFNCDALGNGNIIEGLTIECSNCRYCIHDEMGSSLKPYHHIFKNLTLINNSIPSSVLIAPRAIGGGLGENGFIEIENCVFSSNTNADVTYHSKFTGTQSENCQIILKDSELKTTAYATSIGTSTDFINTMKIFNCLCGSLPQNNKTYNAETICWNNTLK